MLNVDKAQIPEDGSRHNIIPVRIGFGDLKGRQEVILIGQLENGHNVSHVFRPKENIHEWELFLYAANLGTGSPETLRTWIRPVQLGIADGTVFSAVVRTHKFKTKKGTEGYKYSLESFRKYNG